ncbi:uncharacterized protein [Typha latifolia]|uniref:uncharacterized protein n=1 Tax=Typha latifolia TaxID=4733 RepID=UPI003C2E38D8
MECNKEEAIRAKEIAERKMQDRDFVGARKVALKAQRLFPDLENISQMLTVCEVHCSAGVKVYGEIDWYGILQVEATADESLIKKQYRKLALCLHPDKNKFSGAEAAFKLIGEAHMMLSDRAKRSVYDIKRNGNIRTALTKQPSYQSKKTSSVRNNANTANFNGLNQQQPAGSQTFWTICPFCGMRYQYFRSILKKALRCQNCLKPFIAYDLNTQAVPSAANSGFGCKGSDIPQQQYPGQQAHVTSQQWQFANSVANTGFQGNVGGKPGINCHHADGPINKDEGGKEADDGAGDEVKFEKVKLAEMNRRDNEIKTSTANPAKPSSSNARQKRGRKVVEDSSDSETSDSENLVVEEDEPEVQCCRQTSNRYPRRSSRQKQNVTYNENETDDEGDDNDDDFLNPPSSKKLKKAGSSCHADQTDQALSDGDSVGVNAGANRINISNNVYMKQKGSVPFGEEVPNGSEVSKDKVYKGKEEIGENEENRGAVPDLSDPDSVSFSYPDPEFFDFEKFRDVNQFAADQIWALYDNLDGMPRFYARIRHVDAQHFKVRFTWLEHDPTNEAEMTWSDEELPVACGKFKLGKAETTQSRLMFSHIIPLEKGRKRNTYDIYPRKGDVWALYKGWDIGWCSDAQNHRLYEYELVEVLSDFTVSTGISVIPLLKIKGFVSLFMQAKDIPPYAIPSNEILRFSHFVPCYKMTGTEREHIPSGAFELDPAALPINYEGTSFSVTLDSMNAGKLGTESYGSSHESAANRGRSHTTTVETANVSCQDLSSQWKTEVSENECDHINTSQQLATENQQNVGNNVEDDMGAWGNNVHDANRCNNSQPESSTCSFYEYPYSEFHNFEDGRSFDKVQEGQIWALYSDIDKFPKYYILIKKVEFEHHKVDTRWLEACPQREEERIWLEGELPLVCGDFKVANWGLTYNSTDAFSHLVQTRQTGGKHHYQILPSTGEIWAIYRNWRAGWTLLDVRNCEYDVVEICQHTGGGMKVSLLSKVDGHSTVFMPDKNGKATKTMELPEDEYMRFSHQIPAFRLTNERGGKLQGYWELDPASVPEALLFSDFQ